MENEDVDELLMLQARLKTFSMKQDAITAFQKVDAPSRFAALHTKTEVNLDSTIRLIPEIPKDVIELSDRFRPIKTSDGQLKVPGQSDRLKEIEAEFKVLDKKENKTG